MPGVSGNFKTVKYLICHVNLHINIISNSTLTPFLHALAQAVKPEAKPTTIRTCHSFPFSCILVTWLCLALSAAMRCLQVLTAGL
jgi:hypothetical protein